MRRGLGTYLVALALVSACPAAAAPAQPLVPSEVTPADGASINATRGAIEFAFRVPQQSAELNIEISGSPALGQDGTLADDYHIESAPAAPSDVDPTRYTATFYAYGGATSWTNTPGTYYWQISGSESSSGPPYYVRLIGPVYTLTIQAGADRVTQEEIDRFTAACYTRSARTDFLRRRVRSLVRGIDRATDALVASRLRKRLRTVRQAYRRSSAVTERTCRHLQELTGG
jgi:hypothetical protein